MLNFIIIIFIFENKYNNILFIIPCYFGSLLHVILGKYKLVL